MKICIVTHKVQKGDGQARVNYELVKELQARNYAVTLVSSGVADELLLHPGTMWLKVPVRGWPSQLLKNLVFSLISTVKLAPIRRSFDVVMVNGFITWAGSDVNAVHFVHSSWLKSAAHPFRLRKNAAGLYQALFTSVNAVLERMAFARTRHLVPVSQKVRQEVKALGVGGDIRVIMNGVDPGEFYPAPDRDRRDWGLKPYVPLALFTGDIKSPRKNLDTVLKALTYVPELHLAVAGATEGSPYIRMAEELGLSQRVRFLGFRTDVARLMQAADFFVFPSRYEACTLAVIEALASGLPVITTYQSGVAELVRSEREAGIVLDDPEDVNSLAEAMRRLARDGELRKRLGLNARAVACGQSWRSVSDQYIELFHEAVAKKNCAYSGMEVGVRK